MARKKNKDRIPYTNEEIEYIKEASLKNLKDLAFSMNRSYSSVRRKKWALENKERDVQKKKEYAQRQHLALTGGVRTYDFWTKQEIELIMKSNLTDQELAKRLQRSIKSIQMKRHRILKEKNKK